MTKTPALYIPRLIGASCLTAALTVSTGATVALAAAQHPPTALATISTRVSDPEPPPESTGQHDDTSTTNQEGNGQHDDTSTTNQEGNGQHDDTSTTNQEGNGRHDDTSTTNQEGTIDTDKVPFYKIQPQGVNPPSEEGITPEDAQKRLGVFLHLASCVASRTPTGAQCQALYQEIAKQGGPIWKCVESRGSDWFVCLGATENNPIK
ncbi:hypothetical protein [Streptomyces sp. H27-H5]|uniref:hypothetical protein n=1 Tax=Streptomyces sp. H27-H5 TaxID=2996460 RepID=UPI00226E68DB|nr:hypothetical protein [Streptomyces sp. H27-H5]MCY0961577.1 hypothetical protein [Streptomyces sp. H27-H5]